MHPGHCWATISTATPQTPARIRHATRLQPYTAGHPLDRRLDRSMRHRRWSEAGFGMFPGGGRCWIRTNEGNADGFTDCPHMPSDLRISSRSADFDTHSAHEERKRGRQESSMLAERLEGFPQGGTRRSVRRWPRARPVRTSCATTTAPTAPEDQRLAGTQPEDHAALHPPTSGSWLNLVEVYFGILSRQAIRHGTLQLRRRPDRDDQHLNRRLERTLRALHLDQDGRRGPRQSGPAEH